MLALDPVDDAAAEAICLASYTPVIRSSNDRGSSKSCRRLDAEIRPASCRSIAPRCRKNPAGHSADHAFEDRHLLAVEDQLEVCVAPCPGGTQFVGTAEHDLPELAN